MAEPPSAVSSLAALYPGGRAGRPRSKIRTVSLNTRVPEDDYDYLARLALKQKRSLSSIVRDLITEKIGRRSA